MAKLFLVLCASALFVQAISCACIGNGLGNAGISNTGYSSCGNGVGNTGISSSVGYSGCGNSLGYGNAYGNGYSNGFSNGYGNAGNNAGYGVGVATSGGGLTVSSASPLAPSGLSVSSDNNLVGTMAVSGALPFLTAVALEGEVASGGSAGVQYSCGNGNIGIVSENVSAAGNGYGAGQGYGSGLGYGAGLGNGAGFGIGSGLGNGAGFGNGAGLGIGSGLGCGVGLGNGAGSGSCGCYNF